jgi:ubiquinone/menaquinone biosynthesis C-methylase UbiE
MTDTERTYIPAAGHDWSLPFYDPISKLLGGDSARGILIEQADLQPDHRVLEVGCGTGTLLTLVKRMQPLVQPTGLDPDEKALARAKRKADRASVSIQLDRGFSDTLPYPDASFDRVFSCFMFHHLKDVAEKRRTLREIRRVLRPGGRLHLLDFSRDESAAGALARWLHSNDRLKDNTEHRVLSLMHEADLIDPVILRRGRTLFFVFSTAYFQAFGSKA